jgi:pSer/pThr/pTyr-binding forkhead associated (FHA) protein
VGGCFAFYFFLRKVLTPDYFLVKNMSNSQQVPQPSQSQSTERKGLATLTLCSPPGSESENKSLGYSLSTTEVVGIGREPGCQIVIDSTRYTSTSRRHAEVRPLATKLQPAWHICDLSSANGTYVNGKRIEGCQLLRSGDRLRLSKDGPKFVFEYNPSTPVQPPAAANASQHSATASPPVNQPPAVQPTQPKPLSQTSPPAAPGISAPGKKSLPYQGCAQPLIH